MKIAKNYTKHIFCLEGDWHHDLRDKSSVTASLMFLQQNFGIKYIYKQCGTTDNLRYYLSMWKQKKYRDYSIGYLAFHGECESIEVGKNFVTLDELANILEDSCKDKIIHFGSCKTLNTKHSKIVEFLRKTKALCVCGFKSEIEFLESSVFDMLLIDMLQQYKDISIVDRELKSNYKALVKKLDFKLVHL